MSEKAWNHLPSKEEMSEFVICHFCEEQTPKYKCTYCEIVFCEGCKEDHADEHVSHQIDEIDTIKCDSCGEGIMMKCPVCGGKICDDCIMSHLRDHIEYYIEELEG